MIYTLIVCSFIAIVIANRVVLQVKSKRMIAKMSLLRGCIKLIVGILFGLLLAVAMNLLHVQSGIAILGMFIGTLILASIVSVSIYQQLLKKFLNLDFSMVKILKTYALEVAVTLGLTTVAITLYAVSESLTSGV